MLPKAIGKTLTNTQLYFGRHRGPAVGHVQVRT